MASPFLFFLLLSSLSSIPFSQSKLTLDYYAKSCPKFEDIMRDTITPKQINNPTTAAATLRVFFHDCMVDGCDASVLVSSNHFNQSERDADLNHSLPGDAFDLVVRAKTALEMTCPGIVSCADILAYSTRHLVKQTGGPFYQVRLGRKDSLTSDVSHVEPNVPRANASISQMISTFESKGFTVREMVALTGGGHTIGFAHCKEFSNRIFGYSKTSDVEPTLHPKFAERLKELCANYITNPSMAAFLDPITSNKFDNMYFQNLQRGLGLLASDQVLLSDPRTKPVVETYARDQAAFFTDFGNAMEKMSVYGVKTGRKGEVRRRCDAFNSMNV